MNASLETEYKFDIASNAEVPSLDGFAVTDDREFDLVAVYWDTDDRRLLQWGASLRHRSASDGSEDGWTLKIGVPADADDSVARNEISTAGSSESPPLELTDAVSALVLDSTLSPVATIATHRHVRHVGSDIRTPAAEVADDHVTSTVLGEEGPAFRQVEVELLDPAAADTFEQVARTLRSGGLVRSGHGSKVEQVLGGRVPNPLLDGSVGSRSTSGDLVRLILGRGTARLVAADPMVRLGGDDGGDVEAVHRARKATRDLRSQLRTLKPVLDRDQVRLLRGELKWLGQLLGELRDVHVLGALLEDQLGQLDASNDAGASEIRARVDEQREFRTGLLLSALSGDRYLTLLVRLEAAAADPPFRGDAHPGDRARPMIRRRTRSSWRRARRRKASLDAAPAPGELHELRKDVKQARAAAQAARRVDLDSKRFVKRSGELKDVLGDHHDAVVWMQWLTEQHPRFSGDASFLAGRLHHCADERRRSLESTWRDVWRETSRPVSTGWMH